MYTVTFHVPNILGNPLTFHLSCACLLCCVWILFSFKEENPEGMGYSILAGTRNPFKLSLTTYCLWKTSSICAGGFSVYFNCAICFPP